MKTFQKIIVGICIIAVPFISSCKKDDPQTCNYATELQVQSTAISNALIAYTNDPSTANCQAYKASLQAYLNASVDFKACANAAGQGVEFQNYLDTLQLTIDTLQC